MLERTGGIVTQPVPEGAKCIALVDARAEKGGELADFGKALSATLRPPVVFGAAENAAITLTLTDGGAFTLDPASGRASVPAGGTAAETEANLWAALMALLGSKTSPVSQGGHLVAVQAFGAMKIPQVRRASYRRACEEGWAPAPTNEFQRAVFEDVRTNGAARTPPAQLPR